MKEEAEQFFRETLKNVNPKEFIPSILKWVPESNSISIYNTTFDITSTSCYLIGMGKASPTMAEAVEKILGDKLKAGCIIAPPGSQANLTRTDMHIGSHPLPDENSFAASEKLVSFIQKIPENALIINLISGGTSSLVCSPADGVSKNELRALYKHLLHSGATIQEINTVRKTISTVKGGQLLSFFNNRITLVDLIISDIPNDDLKYVGSGPSTSQEISFEDAISVLHKYGIWSNISKSLQNYFLDTCDSIGSFRTDDLDNHHQWIVSSASKVAEETKNMLSKAGYETTVIQPAWTGLIDEFEKHITYQIETTINPNVDKQALILFGECTVKITGDGLGGRNQELALRMAKRLDQFDRPITFLSCGTDGIDGPTDVAGAVVDQQTIETAIGSGLNPDEFIHRNDSYHFFKKRGGHIHTGPTGNNVMDLQIILIH